MFCSNCGKKVEDGAKFCAECGHQLGGSQPANNNVVYIQPVVQAPTKSGFSKGTYRTLMLIVAIISSVTYFLPFIGFRYDYFIVSGEESFSLMDFLSESLGEGFDGGTIIVFLTTAVSIIIGLATFVMLCSGEDDERFLSANSVASGFSLVRFVGYFIYVSIVAYSYSGSIFGGEIVLTFWSWLSGIGSILCLSLFRPKFEKCEAQNGGMAENTAFLSKVCPKCHTSFSIGDICPKCGTRVM